MSRPAGHRLLPAIACTALLAACTGVGVDPMGMEIVEDVSPIRPMAIDQVCVRVDTAVKSEFTDGLFAALEDQGLSTRSMQTAFAGECPFWVRYEAAWSGFPSYLVTARVEVYEGNALLGHARYDASDGGGRPDRFGSAIGKMQPLIEGMLHHVERQAAEAASND